MLQEPPQWLAQYHNKVIPSQAIRLRPTHPTAMAPAVTQTNKAQTIPTVISKALASRLFICLQYPRQDTRRSANSGKRDLHQMFIGSSFQSPFPTIYQSLQFSTFADTSCSTSTPSPTSPSEYPCLYPDCGHKSSRAHDLKRHMTIHFPPGVDELLDCKYEWCGRVGAYGFKREDHRKEHYRKVHMKVEEYPKTGKGGKSSGSSKRS